MSGSWKISDLPPAPETMTEQEKEEQVKRMRKVMFKIFARMPIQEIIKMRKNMTENRGH